MFLSFWYLAFRCVLGLVLLRPRSTEFKELELVVLRHQLAVGSVRATPAVRAVPKAAATSAARALDANAAASAE